MAIATTVDVGDLPQAAPARLLGLPLESLQEAALDEADRIALREFFALVRPFLRTIGRRPMTDHDWFVVRAAIHSLQRMGLTIFCPVLRCEVAFAVDDPQLPAIMEAARNNPTCTQGCCLTLYGG